MTVRTEMEDPVATYWMVSVNEATTPYRRTRNIGVVAMSLLQAIQAIMEKHPNTIVVSANHHGAVDIIGDLEVMALEYDIEEVESNET